MIIFNLKNLLKINKITLYQLSEKSEVSLKSIYRLVNNEVKGCKFTTLDKIARALDVPIDELFDREDQSDEGSH